MVIDINIINSSLKVAIDIAKQTHVVLIEDLNKTRKQLKINNQLADFNALKEVLMAPCLPVLIAFEPTADYHRNLAHFLQSAGFTCYFVSSVAVARTRDALFNAWDKMILKTLKLYCICWKPGLYKFIMIHYCIITTISKNFQILIINYPLEKRAFIIVLLIIIFRSTSRR